MNLSAQEFLDAPSSAAGMGSADEFLGAPPQHNAFVRGILGGVEGVKTGFGGVAEMTGEKFGLPTLADWGRQAAVAGQERAQELAAPTDSLENVGSVGDAGSYVAHTLGSTIPSVLGYLGSAAVGAAVLPGAGALVGPGVYFGAQGAGNVYHEAVKEGLTDPTTRALLGGTAEGALAAFVPGGAAVKGGVAKALEQELKDVAVKKWMREGAKQAGIGAVLGAGQAVTERVALDKPVATPEAIMEAINAAVPMGVIGGGFGAFHARSGIRAAQKELIDRAAAATEADIKAGEPITAPPLALPHQRQPGPMVGPTQPSPEAIAADQTAVHIAQVRQAEEARRSLVDNHLQVVDELKKAGVEPDAATPWPDFVRQQQEAAKQEGGLLTPEQLRDAYAVHQNDVMESNFTKAQDLEAKTAGERAAEASKVEGTLTAPPIEAGAPGGVAPEPTAMGLALSEALKNKQISDAYAQHEVLQAATKDQQLTAIQNIAHGADLVSMANHGAVPDTVKVIPAAPKMFLDALDAVKPAEMKSLPSKLKQELAMTVKSGASLDEQIAAVKTLQEAKKPNSASYELLGKLHDKLVMENENAIPKQGAGALDVRQEAGNGERVGGENPQPEGAPAEGGQGNAAGAKGEQVNVAQTPEAQQVKPAEAPKGKKAGRPEGTTDDRHTIDARPINPDTGKIDAAASWVSMKPLSEWKGLDIRQFWLDLKWALDNEKAKGKEGEAAREILENGKATDEQVARAPAEAEKIRAADELISTLVSNTERIRAAENVKGVASDIRAFEKGKKARQADRTQEAVAEMRGEDYGFGDDSMPKLAPDVEDAWRATDHPEIAAAAQTGKISNLLTAMYSTATPLQKEVINRIKALNLKTTIGYVNGFVLNKEDHVITGNYSPRQDVLTLTHGGLNTSTGLHEAVHAATVSRLEMAAQMDMAVMRGERTFKSLTFEEQKLVMASRDLVSLYLDAKADAASKGFKFYGLESVKNPLLEFVAEAHSNPVLQDFLKSGDRTKWQRFVDAVRRLIGLRGTTDLDKVLTASEPFFSSGRGGADGVLDYSTGPQAPEKIRLTPAEVRYFRDAGFKSEFPNSALEGSTLRIHPEDRAAIADWVMMSSRDQGEARLPPRFYSGELEKTLFGHQKAAESLDFDAGPVQAMNKTHAVLSDVIRSVDEAATGVRPFFTKMHLAATTLNHIKQVFSNILPEQHASALNDWISARDKVSAMVTERNHVTSGIADKMAALDATVQKSLYWLMGESSRNNIVPGKSLADHPWITTPEQKQMFRKIQQEYAKAGVKDAYDAALAHNRKDFEREFATLLRNQGYLYGAPRDMWAAIDPTKGYSPETKVLRDWIRTNGSEEARQSLQSVLSFHQEKRNSPYFHLGRFGDNFVRFDIVNTPEAKAAVQKALGMTGLSDRVMVGTDASHVFSRFEKIGELRAIDAQLTALEKQGHITKFSSGQLEKSLRELDSTTPNFIRSMIDKIATDTRLDDNQKAEMQDLMRRWSIEMLPETSASKAFARRAQNGGVPGYDADMRRSFVKRASASSYFVANNSVRPELSESMRNFQHGIDVLEGKGPNGAAEKDVNRAVVARQVYQELRNRQANDIAPIKNPGLEALGALGYSYYLAGNPAFLISNLFQPAQVALPVMGARYGFAKSAKAMFSGSKTAWSIIKDTIGEGYDKGQWRGILDANISIDRAKNATENEKTFLKALVASGQAEWTQAHELGRILEGEGKASSTAAKLGGTLMHYSEAVNRMSTGLAAFNLEMARHGDMAKATQAGIQSVKDTQFDYSAHNRARALGTHGILGPVTPIVTAFMQFQVQTMELLGRLAIQAVKNDTPGARAEALKALAGTMTMTTMLAGTLGLPFASLVSTAANSIFSSENEPVDAKASYREWLANTFGKDAGEIIAHGALRASGADIASHIDYADLMPFSKFLADRRALKDRIDSGAVDMLGPTVGAAKGITLGASDMADGNVLKGLGRMLPAFLKGPVKAADLAQHGYTDAKGNEISPTFKPTGWDIFSQALNFTPARKAERTEAALSYNTTESLLKQRKSAIEDKVLKAGTSRDPAALQAAMLDVKAFNEVNPVDAIRNIGGIFRRNAMKQATAEISGTGVGVTSARKLAKLRGLGFANVGETE